MFPFINESNNANLNSNVYNRGNIKSLISELNKQYDDDTVSISDNTFKSKYYNYEEFLSIPDKCKSFSALHINIASLTYHFDEFCTLLSMLKHSFGILAVTESRFSKFTSPSINFSIPGYSWEQTPTESSAGGALLYISNNLPYKLRSDLTEAFYKSKELESIFV